MTGAMMHIATVLGLQERKGERRMQAQVGREGTHLGEDRVQAGRESEVGVGVGVGQ